jgi:predicted MFS family arabinose efflux permease
MAKFKTILKNRDFFLLWVGQIISQFGDRLTFMSLIGFAYSKGEQGSPTDIFKILFFTIIPVFVIGPVAGAYVDRWDRRKTMYACDFLRMGLVLLIPLFLFHYRSLPLAFLLVFLSFSVARFFLPAKLSIIPDLVDKKDLLIANSLVNITGMIAFIFGSGIGGLLVEKVGAENGFYLDGLSFFISGLMIFFISSRKGVSINLRKIGRFGGELVEAIKKSLVQEIREGFFYFLKTPDIRFTASILFTLASALGVVSVVSIVFVQDTLGSATKDLGFLIMFLGVGLFFGTLTYGRFGQRLSVYKAIFASLILSGIMLVAFAVGLSRYPDFRLAAVLALAFGFLTAPILIVSNTIIHKTSENSMRGKIFSSLELVMHLGFLLFMYISTILAERFSHVSILSAIGIVFCFVGIINFIFCRKMSWLD